jgi:hypothetical protein
MYAIGQGVSLVNANSIIDDFYDALLFKRPVVVLVVNLLLLLDIQLKQAD